MSNTSRLSRAIYYSEWAPPNWAPGRCWCGKLGPSIVGPPKSQIQLFGACALRALGLFLANGAPAPTVGWGKTFWRVSRFFFLTKTAVTRKQKVEKSIQRCEIDRLAEGYKQAIYEIRVQKQKTDFRAKIRIFGPKKHPFLDSNHVLATNG